MAINRKKVTMDGNEAAAYVAYAFSEFSGIYPITPSSAMADLVDQWSNQKKTNILLYYHTLKQAFFQYLQQKCNILHQDPLSCFWADLSSQKSL